MTCPELRMLSKQSLCRCLALAAIPAMAAFGLGSAYGGEFFRIAATTGGRVVYLYGEDVSIDVVVSNPTPGHLKYMRQGQFIAGAHVNVYRDGQRLVPTGETAGRPVWVETLVTEMNRDPLSSRYSISTSYGAERKGALDPGRYTVVAELRQDSDRWGLATGAAVSNEIQFTVKKWVPKRVSGKTVRRQVIITTVQLVETTEKQFLVSWKDVVGQYEHLLVVPIEPIPAIENVAWDATQDRCFILHQEQAEGTRKLTIVDRNASSVTSVTLSPFKQ